MAALTEPLRPLRRVVTANDTSDRSYFLEDGPPPRIQTVDGRPGFRSANLWRTQASPATIAATDSVVDQQGVMPPPSGTVLRVIDYPPRPTDPEERRRQASASLRALFPDAAQEPTDDRPGMHRTLSVDYAIVLSGTITAILDNGEPSFTQATF